MDLPTLPTKYTPSLVSELGEGARVWVLDSNIHMDKSRTLSVYHSARYTLDNLQRTGDVEIVRVRHGWRLYLNTDTQLDAHCRPLEGDLPVVELIERILNPLAIWRPS